MQVNEARIFLGRFNHNEDLLDSLNIICKEENISLGTFSVIGALRNLKLGYYKQDDKKYIECASISETLEITSCIGNISLFNSTIFIHAHITVADHKGQCFGGHLMPGSKIFAAEYNIKELSGAELNRVYDKETGLNLWQV